MTVAGKIYTAQDVREVLMQGIDFVAIGRAAILHHDYPQKVLLLPNFEPTSLPVTRNYLRKEGLGRAFVEYMTRWDGFVS